MEFLGFERQLIVHTFRARDHGGAVDRQDARRYPGLESEGRHRIAKVDGDPFACGETRGQGFEIIGGQSGFAARSHLTMFAHVCEHGHVEWLSDTLSIRVVSRSSPSRMSRP